MARLALGGLLATSRGLQVAHGQELDLEKTRYALAVAYCRGTVERPISLSDDHQILCFDGRIPFDLTLTRILDLKEGGLFVVRSKGGSIYRAIDIADLLDAKRATVVIYDYCLSACAGYFFLASARTHVFEKALVAFHYPVSGFPDCARIGTTLDNDDKRLIVEPCPIADQTIDESFAFMGWPKDREFYDKRVIDRQYGSPPQSTYMRRYLRGLFQLTGQLPGALWMWNPRFYRTAVKTDISYEHYPESQSEVDELADKFDIGPIIRDP